jgi:hypothetical protein
MNLWDITHDRNDMENEENYNDMIFILKNYLLIGNESRFVQEEERYYTSFCQN